MNDKEIDALLEQAREQIAPEISPVQAEAICNGLHTGIRQQRRLKGAILVIGCALAVVLWGLMLQKPKESVSVQTDFSAVQEQLALARKLFPECGVALVNGEFVVCERQEDAPEMQCLQIRLTDADGQEMVNMDVILSEEDYVVFNDGPVTGDLLLSRCARNGESVVECNLNFCRSDGISQRIQEAMVLSASGSSEAVVKKGTLEEGNRWRLSMETIHLGSCNS